MARRSPPVEKRQHGSHAFGAAEDDQVRRPVEEVGRDQEYGEQNHQGRREPVPRGQTSQGERGVPQHPDEGVDEKREDVVAEAPRELLCAGPAR